MKNLAKIFTGKLNHVINTITITVMVLSPQIALAAPPTGNGLKTWFVDVGKNGVIIVLLFRLLESFARQSIGRMLGALLLGGIVLWFVNSPDSASSIIRQIGELFGQ